MTDSSDRTGPPDQSDRTRIIRRLPEGGMPASSDEPLARRADNSDEPLARRADNSDEPLARRADSSDEPLARRADSSDEPLARRADNSDDTRTSYIPRARPVAIAPAATTAGPATAAAAAVATILSGWATAVIATDLISGWWRTDRLFCIAIGFLAGVSGAASIGGLILLLLRRRMGGVLIVVGCVIGLMIFASLFVAGAQLPLAVYAIPVLPVLSIVLALLPSTRRWSRLG